MALNDLVTRRKFLEHTGLGLTAVALGCDPDDTAPDDGTPVDTDTTSPPPVEDTDTTSVGTCVETPRDIEGPFYIADVPVREELDLYGDVGPRLTVTGRVLDAACAPLAGAVVEIWHVAPDGAYDNTSPEMRYRGQTAAAADGTWRFHTLMPVYYGGRPLHVHLKAWVAGVERLTTQIYFADDPEAAGQAPELIVERTTTGDDFACVFDVVVRDA